MRRPSAAVLSAVLLATVAWQNPQPAWGNDITVAPAACVTPFLDQAFPMRWTEHYLMNPPDGIRTWVVCPLTYDNDVVTFSPEVDVRVTGAIAPGATLADVPVCYFTVSNRTNLSQPPYIDGPAQIYQTGLGTSTNDPAAQLWQATVFNIPRGAIAGATQSSDVNDWSASVFCRLPPGYSLTNVFLGI